MDGVGKISGRGEVVPTSSERGGIGLLFGKVKAEVLLLQRQVTLNICKVAICVEYLEHIALSSDVPIRFADGPQIQMWERIKIKTALSQPGQGDGVGSHIDCVERDERPKHAVDIQHVLNFVRCLNILSCTASTTLKEIHYKQQSPDNL